MEHQRKWTGWLLIAVIIVISGSALVMTTLASSGTNMPLATQSPLSSSQPMQSAESMPGSTAVQRTANASVIGYGGPVLVRLTLDEARTITALDIGGARFQETEGVGGKVRNPDFAQSFIGQKPPLTIGKEIDAIAGASVSSKAVVDAVNEAAAFLTETETAASDRN